MPALSSFYWLLNTWNLAWLQPCIWVPLPYTLSLLLFLWGLVPPAFHLLTHTIKTPSWLASLILSCVSTYPGFPPWVCSQSYLFKNISHVIPFLYLKSPMSFKSHSEQSSVFTLASIQHNHYYHIIPEQLLPFTLKLYQKFCSSLNVTNFPLKSISSTVS